MAGKLGRRERWAIGLSVAAGLVLGVIGLRFLTVPHQAARFFGLSNPPGPFDLHLVVGLRDLWLAALLVGLAWLQEWRALGLVLMLGAAVCFGDAIIAGVSSGRASAVLFHWVSGLYCGAVGIACWRVGGSSKS